MTDEKEGRILVVDDIQMTIHMAVRDLQDKYEVIPALSAEEAYEILLENRGTISLVLLDVHLPKMDGYSLMDKMKQTGFGDIPVIMMTADDEPKREVEALRNGASDFVRKPLYAEILRNRVENVLMRHKMEYDALTGLYNRAKTFKMIRRMVAEHPGTKFAFMRFDIDNFSIFNSMMGEEEGNKLLLLGAKTLQMMERDRDTCVFGRIDADVFCVCEIYDEAHVQQRIQATLGRLAHARKDYRLKASFGICVFDDPDVSVEKVYTNASLAAHTCKDIFDKEYAYYEPWMSEQYVEEQEVVNEMVYALENHQFVPYLQPKYDLDSDEPCGAEALVRWIHPTKGMISPGKFIPVFERNGFVAKLDFHMWESVCRILKRWMDEKKKVYPISVNISRISMHNPQLVEMLVELVGKYGLPPELLQLEITESAYMTNPQLMKETIVGLQAHGFTILMDDFGSGYSSLNTLKEINVDILKVDMKFLPEGQTTARSEIILSSVIRMAGWLGIPTIAEGVETLQQRNFLKGIGCDYIQGYYYARPMPVAEYEELVGRNKVHLPKREAADPKTSMWSSDDKINDILTGIQLPVAIIEASVKQIEVVRVNAYYSETFGKDIKEYLDGEGRAQLKHVVHEAAVHGTSEGECSCLRLDGKKKFFRVRIRRMEQSSSACLLCAVMHDITAEKIYGQQLKKLERLVPSTNRTKMLVVDDSVVMRNIIKTSFEEEYEICEAKDGREALEILAQDMDQIAIILLDMFMPVMDGKTFLLEKNRLDQPGAIPVIVMSSESDTGLQLDMLALGVNDYITKPFDSEIFKQKVRNAILYGERFMKIRKEYERVVAEDVDVT